MEITKEYLDQKFSALSSMILANQEDLALIKSNVKEIKDTLNRVDKRDLEDSNLFSRIFNNHEKRLKKLEKATKIR